MQSKIIKTLTRSNLGKAGMHDMYISITKEYQKDGTMENFFGNSEKSLDLIDEISKKTYKVNFSPAKNGEYRITKLGEYFRDKKPKVGDEIHISKADVISWKDSFYVSIYSDQFNAEDEVLMPDEIYDSYTSKKDRKFIEGITTKTTVNKYERNRSARDNCIKHYGPICKCCGIDFKKTYGEIGEGFIHVHHIVPISQIKEEYTVDPIKDLIPVCPNCHAMIHKKNPPFSVDEMNYIYMSNIEPDIS